MRQRSKRESRGSRPLSMILPEGFSLFRKHATTLNQASRKALPSTAASTQAGKESRTTTSTASTPNYPGPSTSLRETRDSHIQQPSRSRQEATTNTPFLTLNFDGNQHERSFAPEHLLDSSMLSKSSEYSEDANETVTNTVQNLSDPSDKFESPSIFSSPLSHSGFPDNEGKPHTAKNNPTEIIESHHTGNSFPVSSAENDDALISEHVVSLVSAKGEDALSDGDGDTSMDTILTASSGSKQKVDSFLACGRKVTVYRGVYIFDAEAASDSGSLEEALMINPFEYA